MALALLAWAMPLVVAAQPAIRQALETRAPAPLTSADWTRWQPAMASLYEARGFAPLWFAGNSPTAAALALSEELRAAGRRGLRPADYSADALYEAVRRAAGAAMTEDDSARLDVALSITAAKFAAELHSGRVDPRMLGFELDAVQPPLDVLPILRELAAAPGPDGIACVLEGLEPAWRRVTLLKEALVRYRALAEELPAVQIAKPARWGLTAGDAYAGGLQLRRLLTALGDLPRGTAEPADPGVLDAASSAALAGFQRRHGLAQSGALDQRTFRALSVPLERRVRQIELALERFRWLPPSVDGPPIVVNIPQFRLFAFYTTQDREDAILRVDVIVGRTFARFNTPVFAADMTHVIFNPYWDVPYGILTNELLPQIKADPSWMRRNGYEVVGSDGALTQQASAQTLAALAAGTARLRQRPGPNNALGKVKFVFPNRHNVFLHDTPSVELFAATRRAFSHGCIRVADPVALAEYALRENPGWTRARIVDAMKGAAPVRVNLEEPIRVFILYATALAAEDGTMYFFDDIYGHDARLEKALASRQR
jgi:murein L,D-transpeptidase YcbB/YkuD